MKRILDQFDLAVFEEELAFLVNIDSGSRCVAGLNRIADWFCARFEAMGWETAFHEAQPGRFGKSLYARRGTPGELDLLILCHSDTVFAEGTAAARPFTVEPGRFRGPGVADMKAGCLMALHALEQLEAGGRLAGRVGLLLNAEHEVSCPTTRSLIEEKSRTAKVVISTEPARADGSCVRQRKGILRYQLQFHGIQAHSGVDPAKGACAVTEMARTILDLKALEDPDLGINVNPGLVSGGVSVNVVPHYAQCQVDIRVTTGADAIRLDQWIRDRAAAPVDGRVRIGLEGGITRPPLTPTPRGDRIIEAINTRARAYGLSLKWSFSGGGSDASFASSFGVPALCGLGPVGGAYHTEEEYLQTIDLEQRCCIFRDTVEDLCNGRIV